MPPFTAQPHAGAGPQAAQQPWSLAHCSAGFSSPRRARDEGRRIPQPSAADGTPGFAKFVFAPAGSLRLPVFASFSLFGSLIVHVQI